MSTIMEGDVYLDKHKELVIVGRRYGGDLFLLCYTRKDKTFLHFANTLATDTAVEDHLRSARFLFNLAEPLNGILDEISKEG